MLKSTYLCLGLCLIFIPCKSFALPLDAQAVEILEIIRNYSSESAKTELSLQHEQKVLRASESNSEDIQIAAAYAMAFSTSQSVSEKLIVMKHSESIRVSGAAHFAMVIHKARNLKKIDQILIVQDKFFSIDNIYTKLFILEWIAGKYEHEAMQYFIHSLKSSDSEILSAELVVQIANYGASDDVKQALSIIDNDGDIFSSSTVYSDRIFLLINGFQRDGVINRSVVPGYHLKILKDRLGS